MKRFRLLSLVFLATVVCSSIGWSQTFRFDNGTNESRRGQSRPNVQKELRLSAAQREEIVSIVSSMKNDTRALRRKLESLRADYRIACLQKQQDEKELNRIQSDIQATHAEINAVAMKKMTEIKQLLTSGQAAKLAELRKAELDRIEAAEKRARGDVSIDNLPQTPTAHSFSMQTWTGGGDEKYFSADEVFVYPDRALWIDSPFGNTFSVTSNGDVNMGDMGSFGRFFGDGENGFSFNFPQFREFNRHETEEDSEDLQRPDRQDQPSDLMDDTPYTLPKPKNTPEKSNSRLKRQVEELREKLKKLELRLEEQEKK